MYFNLGRHEMNYAYKKRHCSDMGRKRDKTVKTYCRKPSLLEQRSNEVVCQEYCSSSPSSESSSIIEQEDDSVPQIVMIFVIES